MKTHHSASQRLHHTFVGLIVVLSLALTAISAQAQQVTTPQSVMTSQAPNPTLGIPRWKGYVSSINTDHFWLSVANQCTSCNNILYTTDAGETWSSTVMQPGSSGYMDYHLSLFGMGGELYYTFPGSSAINFRKFNSPAHSNSDRGDLESMTGTTPQHRSNVMVESTGRIWVFTRRGDSPAENVRYHYSDNDGLTWTSGVAFATGTNNVRIGSMPYVGGRPALIVHHLESSVGYEYYLWNGSSFEARPDHSIRAQNFGYERAFTHNVVRDTTMHLIYGIAGELVHLWKNYNNGTGSWSYEVIETEPNNGDGMAWSPITTVQGDDLYLFYSRKTSSADASSMIYYKKWSQLTQTWTDPVLVSTGLTNQYNVRPNTSFHVPESSDYIPVFWHAGASAPYTIYFAKIQVNGSGPADTTPPAAIGDLSVSEN